MSASTKRDKREHENVAGKRDKSTLRESTIKSHRARKIRPPFKQGRLSPSVIDEAIRKVMEKRADL